MRLHFLGAARAVTGSLHVLDVGGKRVALDCGLVQGHRAESRRANAELRVDATTLDAVILSHAHVDHSGNLPTLVKNGFRGRIHATSATLDLARILLHDSAHIQKVDAAYMTEHAHRHAKGRTCPGGCPAPVPPLYDDSGVDATVERFKAQSYHEPFDVIPGVRARFIDAGHLLGSAVTLLDLDESGRTIRLGYTGDLGRSGHPIIRDPERVTSALDFLVTESTYGDRVHDALPDLKRRLGDTLARAFERGGRVIIPAFSVGRTQTIVYYLKQLFRKNALAPAPIFVDSPLSVDATEVYRNHPECYDEETRRFLSEGDEADPFGFKLLTYIRDVEESKALNDREGPCVIISASGMCEHGRILHHLKNNLGRPENVVLMTGFQPVDTLGRRLIDHHRHVKVFGEDHKVRAEVVVLNGFSAHADREELSSYAKNIESLRGVFVVHGEERAALSLAEHLKAVGLARVVVPSRGDVVELA